MFYTYSLPSRAALSLSLDHNLTHKNTENSRPLASSHFIQGARSERAKRPLAIRCQVAQRCQISLADLQRCFVLLEY